MQESEKLTGANIYTMEMWVLIENVTSKQTFIAIKGFHVYLFTVMSGGYRLRFSLVRKRQ